MGLPSTLSSIELIWVSGAVIGLAFTLICLSVMVHAAWKVAGQIRLGVLTWTGPRWSYALGMAIAMALFLPGWIAFLVIGVIAGEIPPNPAMPARYGDLFSYLVVAGEVCFACGQVAITLVWFRVRAVAFQPPRLPTARSFS